MTTRQNIGKQIEALRKSRGVSTYDLEKKGIHPSLPTTIERGHKGYTIDSLIKYLHAIDPKIKLEISLSHEK